MHFRKWWNSTIGNPEAPPGCATLKDTAAHEGPYAALLTLVDSIVLYTCLGVIGTMPGELRWWRCPWVPSVLAPTLIGRSIPTWYRRPVSILTTGLLNSHAHRHLQRGGLL